MILSQIGKVKTYNFKPNWENLTFELGFYAKWEFFRSIKNFFSAKCEKIWYRKPDPILSREKAL